MYVFTGKNISVSIQEAQVKETTLYKDSLCIELFNKTRIRLDGEYDKLIKIFKALEKKSKGNFINTVEIQT
ncbi:MAG: hypothetical protein ACLVH8_10555 [Fusobacterium sp.]